MSRAIIHACLASVVCLLAACSSDGPTSPTVTGYSIATKTAPPATAAVGTTVAIAFTVTESRSDGSTAAANGKSVTLAVTAGGGTVNGSASATVTTSSDGSVSANWQLGNTVGPQTLRASVSATQFVDASVSATPPPATQLALTATPSATAQSGARLATQPTVQLRDANGNAVAQAQIPITVAIDGGGVLTGDALTVNTNANGAAAFSGLTITGLAGARTLRFSATLNGANATVTSPVALSAGAAAQLAFATAPSTTATNGVALGTQPSVQLQDAGGNAVAQAQVPVTVTISAGGGAIVGTTTVNTNASGVAAFTGLSLTGLVGARTLSFSATLGGTAVSLPAAINLNAGAASQLAVSTAPSASAQSGAVLAQQPTVQIRDVGGNAVALAGIPITVALDGVGTLAGTPTVNSNASGAAQFTGLAISGLIGNRTLRFSATLGGAATNVVSAPIALTAGAAAQFTLVQPIATNQTVGFPLSPQPAVQVSDAAGNPVSQAGVVVSVAQVAGLSLPASAAQLTGALTATTNSAGVATFSNLTFVGNAGTTALSFSGTIGGQTRTLNSANVSVGLPSNGKIVFKRGRDEIWVINPDGSGLTRLTLGYGNSSCERGDEFPVWSPDGTKIAFSRTRDNKMEIWTMNADGSGQTQLTFDASTGSGCTGGPQQTYSELPAWSPDGQKIIFTRDASTTADDQDTWIMNADGSNQTKLFGSVGVREGQAVFSPDGQTIAYRRTVLTGTGCRGTSNGTEVWLANADGSNERRLTTIDGCSVETFPYWSPDGLQLFVSVDAAALTCGAEIVRVATDPMNLSRTLLTNCLNGEASKHSRVSPDGTRVVFHNGGGNGGLWLMRADGTQKELLTMGPSDGIDDAHWQPVKPTPAAARARTAPGKTMR